MDKGTMGMRISMDRIALGVRGPLSFQCLNSVLKYGILVFLDSLNIAKEKENI